MAPMAKETRRKFPFYVVLAAYLLFIFGVFQVYNILQSSTLPVFRKGQCEPSVEVIFDRLYSERLDYRAFDETETDVEKIKSIMTTASNWFCLPRGHSFHVTFDPDYPGVILNPDQVAKHLKSGITIAIENQFKDLVVTKDGISVIVFFDGKGERIFIPYSAITHFSDPSHGFQLNPYDIRDGE